MNSTRDVMVGVLVAVMLFGSCVPSALAQQNSQSSEPPMMVTDMTAEYAQPRRSADIYDMGATVATIFKAPGNVVTCVFGGAFGAALFLMTLGSAYKASTRVIEEGCAQKWIIGGDELRPTAAFERRTSGYGHDQR